MQRLMNDGWLFAKTPTGCTPDASQYSPVDLPHDWLIWQTDDLYECSDGWYRRVLDLPCVQPDWRYLLRFDGVYMNCDVLLNGELVCSHRYGYTAFDADLTPFLHTGSNELTVHVRFMSPCSRWYSGAGIFRDVVLMTLPKSHIIPDGI